MMVLDTVDGKLARCTGTSSGWGNIFDHGMDLVHPPFWYWAWGVGLAAVGRPLPAHALEVMAAIVVGYVVQRVIEGAFIASFEMHIHVWERVDSRFRLITARRNPNVVILFASLIVGRPDWGLLGGGLVDRFVLPVPCRAAGAGLSSSAAAAGAIVSWLA